MTPTKMDALRARYPKLELPFCACGDGWYGILERLCAKLVSLNLPPTFTIIEIKEKTGELRVLTSGIPDQAMYEQVIRWIAEVMDESIRVCEICGKPGRRRTRGWTHTFCDECHAQRQ